MIFSSKGQVLILIKKDCLVLYLDSGQSEQIKLPETLIEHLEVPKPQKYQTFLEKIFSQYNLSKKKTVIALAPEVLFNKVFPVTDQEEMQKKIQEFVEMIPFPPKNLTKKSFTADKKLHLFTTNPQLYQCVKEAVQNVGGVVLAVIPIPLYVSLGEGEDLSSKNIKEILNNPRTMKLGDFLTEDKDVLPTTSAQNTLPTSLLLKKIFIFPLIIIILTSAIYISWVSGYLNNPLSAFRQKSSQPPTVSPSITPASSEATASAELNSTLRKLEKSVLKIQILNGSGVAGQASKIRAQLRNLGYENIEVGNLTGSKKSETMVSFSSTISTEIQDEITTEMDKTFSNVSTQENTASSSYDVVITTGK